MDYSSPSQPCQLMICLRPAESVENSILQVQCSRNPQVGVLKNGRETARLKAGAICCNSARPENADCPKMNYASRLRFPTWHKVSPRAD